MGNYVRDGTRIRWTSISVVLLVMLCLQGFTFIVSATQTDVHVSPASSVVSPGDTFCVNVSCVPAQQIKGFEFRVSFNPTYVHATNVSEGTIFNGYTTFFNDGTINNTAGTITNIYDLIVGSGMVSGSGTLVKIAFTTQSSYGTSSIKLLNVGVTNETTYVPVTVTNGTVSVVGYTLTVSTSGQGTVAKNPNQTLYGVGHVVILTATPSSGWMFDHWSGDLTGYVNPASITMNANKTVTATFVQNHYTLTINVVGNGTVSKNPNNGTYTYGTVVTLTATATAGWKFDHWSGNLSGSANPTTITMNGNRTVTATFTQNHYTLTITTVGNGTVAKNPNKANYVYGEVVTVTATANAGWTFDHWSGNLSGSQNPKTITMNCNKSITATFTQNQYTLTITVNGSGNVTKNPSKATYVYGEVVTLTAVPNTGWSFISWSGNLSGSQNPKTITMNSNKAVTATFADTMAPQITGVTRTTSSVLDTDPAYGWVNVSGTVTDNVGVAQVILKIHKIGGSWNNVTMSCKTANVYYYRSTTAFSTAGNYTYYIWTKDTSNNANTSSTVPFSMPANWDVDLDGYGSLLDLVLTSNSYGQSGSNGWIRQDVDNNGAVQVLDLVNISIHFGTTWH